LEIAEGVARAKLPDICTTFAKASGSPPTDAFDGLGLHLYCDDQDQLEFAEAFVPAEIMFRGIHFLGRAVPAVANDLRLLGLNILEDEVGIKFRTRELLCSRRPASSKVSVFTNEGITNETPRTANG